VLVPKHERRFTGFDDKILALYARGLTVREIQGFLREMYAVDVSPDLISTVTDAIVEEVTAWQAGRSTACTPSCSLMPCGFAFGTRARPGHSRIPRLGCARRPARHPGLWIEQTEGAKFWLKVFTDLRARGCEDILIAVTDGLKACRKPWRRRIRTPPCNMHRPSHSAQSGVCELA